MSETKPKASCDDLTPDKIAQWLLANTSFFQQHPEIITSLSLPDDAGTAISLHQYQVRVLKNNALDLEEKLAALLKNAKTNHKIHTDLLNLSGALIRLAYQGKTHNNNLDVIRKHFCLSALKLITIKNNPTLVLDIQTRMGKNKTLCLNKFDAEFSNDIFEKKADSIRSIAIASLNKKPKEAEYLVLGADDMQRFNPNMGGEFLGLLAQLVGCLPKE